MCMISWPAVPDITETKRFYETETQRIAVSYQIITKHAGLNLHLGGSRFETRPRQRLSWGRFLDFLCPSQLMASLVSPRPIPSTSFPIHLSLYTTLRNPTYAVSLNELQIPKSYSLWDVTTHPRLVPWFKFSRAIPLSFPLCLHNMLRADLYLYLYPDILPAMFW
jgi:hypothetical protein